MTLLSHRHIRPHLQGEGTNSGGGPAEPSCLDPKFHLQIPLCKKKIHITSKCRHMYGVLNVDEIKN
jgi:hypothetical protein